MIIYNKLKQFCSKNPAPSHAPQLGHEEHSMKVRDLLTVIDYRNDIRDEQINEMLLMSITTTHSIYPTLGVAELVEFRMRNPFDSEERISIQISDPDLVLVTAVVLCVFVLVLT